MLTIFKRIATDPDLEWKFIYGSMIKTHQHSSGASFAAKSAMEKSITGNSRKIHMAFDSFGLPIEITSGQVHGCLYRV